MPRVEYQKHASRKNKVLKIWYEVLADYNAGTTAIEIAKKHGRTRAWVYYVLKRFDKGEI